ncbi:MAG: dual specificity protein phosphatase family protein [Ktedonobacterales bacterium]
MPRPRKRPRLLAFSHQDALFDARLDTITEEPGGDIVFTFRRLTVRTEPTATLLDGRPGELAEGEYVPMRLRFAGASWIRHTGVYTRIDDLAPDADARRIFGMQHSYDPSIGEYYWVTMGASEPGELMLRARDCLLETSDAAPEPVLIARRWAPTPYSPPRVLHHRPVAHHRYGGDPIRIQLGARWLKYRLFIGGLHHQRGDRPAVDGVLNLCGIENPWCGRHGRSLTDRYAWKGEMGAGMDLGELLDEARWVAERLRGGKRVLVHCYAGVNRSSTVCCAALMLLEGISASEALLRVRERHPVAWPDPYYWFLLRWLSDHPEVLRPPVADAGSGALERPASGLRQELPVR